MTAWATGLQAITTSLALVAAGLAWRESHKLNEREAERDQRQAKLDLERTTQQDRAQASGVAAWPSWGEDMLKNIAGVYVVNSGDAPVFGGVLTFSAGGMQLGELRLSLIPPGKRFLSFPTTDGARAAAHEADVELTRRREDMLEPAYGVTLQFRDASGREWTRDVLGRLWSAQVLVGKGGDADAFVF